jgi:hypothetical protein
MHVNGQSSGRPPAMRRCDHCGRSRPNTWEHFPSYMELPEGYEGTGPCRECLHEIYEIYKAAPKRPLVRWC